VITKTGMAKYKRILLKLSGEALMGKKQSGIDTDRLIEYVSQVKEAVEMGVEVAIVIGGGNIFRGLSGVNAGFDRVKGDQMGMLATVINGLGLQSGFESIGQKARLFTAFRTEPIGEYYIKSKVIDALTNGEVAILTGGTGNPFFTTDTGASLRAVELETDVLLKGTRVDGIYTADPEKDKAAVKFDEITFNDAYNRGLKIMDLTAITMCSENNLPIIVFDMNTPGNLKKVLIGDKIGTLVHN
jgi:uridylate kinase